jgi:hypothetical protein
MDRVDRWTGLTALAAVGLFTVANALWAFEQPAPDASAATIVAFYDDASGRIGVGALLSLLSIAILVAFAALLRSVLVDRGHHRVLGDLVLAGTLLGAAPGLGAETVNLAAAHRAGDGQLTEPLALALFDVSYVLGSYAVGPGFGLFAIALGLAALRDPGLLPRWLALAALVIGALLATSVVAVVIGEYAVAPAFVVVVAVGLRRLRGAGPTLGA